MSTMMGLLDVTEPHGDVDDCGVKTFMFSFNQLPNDFYAVRFVQNTHHRIKKHKELYCKSSLPPFTLSM